MTTQRRRERERQRSRKRSHQARRKEPPGARKERIRARMAASAMASPEELAETLGCTLNKAYEILRHGKVKAMRLNKRWLIPRPELARVASGEIGDLLTPTRGMRLIDEVAPRPAASA
jgi:excisionase family DNA binding protein